jgi:hypothetical protein
MVKKITVHGIRRQEPDVRSFVLALVELARNHVESEASNPANEKWANEYQTSRHSTRKDSQQMDQRPAGRDATNRRVPNSGSIHEHDPSEQCLRNCETVHHPGESRT